MFTGLIKEIGRVVSFKKKGRMSGLMVSASSVDVAVGDSISINGACLTVTGLSGDMMSFDLSEETMAGTNLGELKAGDKVNIEPSLRADGKLGGHFVTGHVDAVGSVRKKLKTEGEVLLEIAVPQRLMGLLVEKGSVAVDGISLTVVAVLKDGFTVVIIPHTAAVTTIGSKDVGRTVNIEADIIGKYVQRFLKRVPTLMETLQREGFA